jgi:uncharacterized protein YceK
MKKTLILIAVAFLSGCSTISTVATVGAATVSVGASAVSLGVTAVTLPLRLIP